MRGFVVRRANGKRGLERRGGGTRGVGGRGRGGGGQGGRREEEQAGTNGLAGSVVQFHSFVLLPLLAFLLLFLLDFFNLQLLRVDLGLLLFTWMVGQREEEGW